MKIINAEQWNPMGIAWYYKSEGEHSAEQFCDDIIIPELKNHDQPFTIDLTTLKVGISSQMLSIIAFYLILDNGYSRDEISKRVNFLGYHEIEKNDFLNSTIEAEHEKARRMLTL